MIRINEIIDKIQAYMPKANLNLIQKAYVFSAAAHAGQTRHSGQPYLSHPLEVAGCLADLHMDEVTITAGLLHDTVEDTKVTLEEIKAQFGESTAAIVDGVTKISQITFDSKAEAQAENFRKMILAMAKDIRVLIVKLADRLHNMRTLDYMKPEKQKAISRETMDIYAPLANRLGLHLIKIQLEDLSLKYLKPDVYAQVSDSVKRHKADGGAYVAQVIAQLENMLKENHIKGRVSGRVKHVFGIYHKMVQQHLTLDQVHDIRAFRIIVSGVKDCYACLGLVHAAWRPVPGRFKDYISMPKVNMYQSLHTAVIGPVGERIEIQIRTEEMHNLAECGVAAHWLYKEDGAVKDREAGQFAWLRQILDWQQHESNSREFMRSLRFDLFKDEVYAFTPKGEVKELPKGATPVDFAYLIHSEIGDHCAGSRVNGRLAPLNTKLQNGDMVEILTGQNHEPNRDWLKFVKTAKARIRIQHYIKAQEETKNILAGREMLEKESRRLGLQFSQALKSGRVEAAAHEMSFKSVEDLMAAVGYSQIPVRRVIQRILTEQTEISAKHEQRPAAAQAQTPGHAASDIKVSGLEQVQVRFAHCCNPVPGDAVVGYISRGRGVVIHTEDCPNVATMELERLIEVSWSSKKNRSDKPYQARIRIISQNTPGILSEISGLLARQAVNIESGSFHALLGGRSEITMMIVVKDSEQLYQIIRMISSLSDIYEVSRVSLSKPD